MLSNDLLDIKGKVLLLVCCAPCSAGVIDFIAKNNLDFTIFFYNPNIYPEVEYVKRKEEVIRLAKLYNIPFVDTDYSPQDYVKATIGLGSFPERGKRCEQCFKLRLAKTAIYARDNKFDYFTSTLGFSRWKDLNQVNSAGYAVEELYNVPYLDVDWRKCGIQPRTQEIIKEQKIYEQKYCGCIYSLKNNKEE